MTSTTCSTAPCRRFISRTDCHDTSITPCVSTRVTISPRDSPRTARLISTAVRPCTRWRHGTSPLDTQLSFPPRQSKFVFLFDFASLRIRPKTILDPEVGDSLGSPNAMCGDMPRKPIRVPQCHFMWSAARLPWPVPSNWKRSRSSVPSQTFD